jgi:hypothetical protein
VDGINAPHTCKIAKGNLVRADTNYWAICFEQFVDGLALLETEDVCREPKVGNGSIPWARDGGEWGKNEMINCANDDVE